MSEATHLVCPHCASVNRIPSGKEALGAKCGHCHKPLFEGRPTPVTAMAFDRHIQRNDIPVVVDFWAEWCGPCRAMAPVFDRAAKAMEPRVRFLKLDTEAEPGIAARYNIRGIPTMLMFKGGKIVGQQVGAVGEQALQGWVQQHAG